MASLIGRCGGGGGLRFFRERVNGPSPEFTVTATPRVLSWSVEQTNDGNAVALDIGHLSIGGSPAVPILVSGANTFVYSWWLSFAWASFAGLRSVTVDVTDVNNVSYAELGYPVTVQGTDATAAQWQSMSGIVVPSFATFPAYLVVTAVQTSGVNQSFGATAGMTETAMMVTAQEQS